MEGALLALGQGDIGVAALVVAEGAELGDGVDAEGVVAGGGEVPGEGHDAVPAVLDPVVAAGLADPTPEESPAACRRPAFRGRRRRLPRWVSWPWISGWNCWTW